MQTNSNVIAAIAAAIGEYLEAEQQLSLTVLDERKAPEVVLAAYSSWAMAGRQSMMEMRRFFQMRLVR